MLKGINYINGCKSFQSVESGFLWKHKPSGMKHSAHIQMEMLLWHKRSWKMFFCFCVFFFLTKTYLFSYFYYLFFQRLKCCLTTFSLQKQRSAPSVSDVCDLWFTSSSGSLGNSYIMICDYLETNKHLLVKSQNDRIMVRLLLCSTTWHRGSANCCQGNVMLIIYGAWISEV